jgi:quinol monooxygenase YgiN
MNAGEEGKMIHRITKYKIREGQAEDVRQAVQEFIQAVRENSPEGVKVDVYREKDGLTFYHVACFRDEKAAEAHTASEQLANVWEAVYERAESLSQSIEVDLIASTDSGCCQ